MHGSNHRQIDGMITGGKGLIFSLHWRALQATPDRGGLLTTQTLTTRSPARRHAFQTTQRIGVLTMGGQNWMLGNQTSTHRKT
jgi:hypothetical protein